MRQIRSAVHLQLCQQALKGPADVTAALQHEYTHGEDAESSGGNSGQSLAYSVGSRAGPPPQAHTPDLGSYQKDSVSSPLENLCLSTIEYCHDICGHAYCLQAQSRACLCFHMHVALFQASFPA